MGQIHSPEFDLSSCELESPNRQDEGDVVLFPHMMWDLLVGARMVVELEVDPEEDLVGL